MINYVYFLQILFMEINTTVFCQRSNLSYFYFSSYFFSRYSIKVLNSLVTISVFPKDTIFTPHFPTNCQTQYPLHSIPYCVLYQLWIGQNDSFWFHIIQFMIMYKQYSVFQIFHCWLNIFSHIWLFCATPIMFRWSHVKNFPRDCTC